MNCVMFVCVNCIIVFFFSFPPSIITAVFFWRIGAHIARGPTNRKSEVYSTSIRSVSIIIVIVRVVIITRSAAFSTYENINKVLGCCLKLLKVISQ